jgi:hypothetical protein
VTCSGKTLIRSVLLCLTACLLTPPASAQTYFFSRADFELGTYPGAVVVGDLNSDGNLDLVVADAQQSSVSILLGRANGTFLKQLVLKLGFGPGDVAIGDFNRDGVPDLALTNWSGNTVAIFLGAGNGRFQPSGQFATGQNPSGITVADFNHDGNLDVAVACGGEVASVLLGNGDGTLQSHVDYAIASGPGGIVAADFNRDGKLDLAIAGGWANVVYVLLGNGDGTFQAITSFEAGEVPNQLLPRDLNGDGILDLVVMDSPDCGCAFLSVLLGNGDGTFKAPITTSIEYFPGDIVVGNFNHDNKLDVAVATAGVVSVLLGNGDGTFQSAVDYGADHSAWRLAVGDFNHDGIVDLAVASFNGNQPTHGSVLLGNGDGTFAAIAAYATGQQPVSVVAADLNSDGYPDLATLNSFDNSVSVLIGTGKGKFDQAVDYAVGIDGQEGTIVVSDFNGDGKQDLATTGFFGGTVSVLLNLGDGTFAKHVDYSVGSYPQFMVTGDFNEDGKVDLVVGNSGAGLSILPGKGDGTFGSPIPFGSGLSPLGIAAADLNHDGKLDLATVNGSQFSDVVSVLLGNGDGTFDAPVNYKVGIGPTTVTAADMNQDGNPDLVVGVGASISVLLGKGDGTFQSASSYPLPATAVALQAADLHGGGKLDVAVVTGFNDPRLSVLEGNGDGTLKPFADYVVGAFPAALAIADFDRDVALEVAVANTGFGGTVTVMRNMPVIALSTAALEFPPQQVGTTSDPLNAILSNPGTALVKFGSISITGQNAGDFSRTTTCKVNLDIGVHCPVAVRFRPSAKGRRSAVLRIVDNALGQTQTIRLSGIGQ